MSDPLYFKTASELSALLEAGDLTSVELTQALIDRTKETDDRIRAFSGSDAEWALEQAKASDERRASGKTCGPLDGIPVGLKDCLAVTDQPLTCSSRMLENFVSPYDATVVKKLKEAGAVLWGRLNMDEFAMGSSTENSAFQSTANPWDLERTPGGSSGGSAAAVAAGQAVCTIGSDTGGSIRQPAALCGTVGLKPTYGRVSRYGAVAFASSLDQLGPITRSVEDAAIMLGAIAGPDDRDSSSMKVEVPDYRRAISEKKRSWKLGVPKEYFSEGLEPEVENSIRQAIEFYKSEGCEIVDISLPYREYSVAVYYAIAAAEASSNLARYDGVRYTHRTKNVNDAIDLYANSRAEGFGEEVKRRIILGTFILSSEVYEAYYLRAQKVRRLIHNEFQEAYQKVDAILTPTTPAPAFRIGAKAEDPLRMYLSDLYTISANLAGIPGISIPCGFSSEGLPIGLQILGKPFHEAELLSIAHQFEQSHPFAKQHPAL